MHWEKPEVLDQFDIRLPWDWVFLHYFDALNALFRIENTLRMFVYVVLKDAKKAKWSDLTLASDDGTSTTIAALARRRLAQDKRFGYLGYSMTAPLMYLTSGELIGIIFQDAYWPLFASYFPATRELVRAKLEEIGNVRNALAHFRPIKPDDVEVVKQNANQMLALVEEELESLILTFGNVPSNTNEEWFIQLGQLAGAHTAVEFHQSQNERWVQLRVIYTSPIVHEGRRQLYDWWWGALTVETPKLLLLAPAIRGNAIFAAERWNNIEIVKDTAPIFKKNVEFVFSRATLRSEYGSIRAELSDLLNRIAEESELLLQDRLARGELVRSRGVIATLQNDKWIASLDSLGSIASADDPAEFWVQRPIPAGDLLTETCFYPWMPTPISSGIMRNLEPA